jgi:hypothetical protein
MDIDGLGYFREPRLVDLEPIHTKGQALHSQSALIIGGQDAPVLVRLTNDLNRGFHRET